MGCAFMWRPGTPARDETEAREGVPVGTCPECRRTALRWGEGSHAFCNMCGEWRLVSSFVPAPTAPPSS